jgi:hypothetical protein
MKALAKQHSLLAEQRKLPGCEVQVNWDFFRDTVLLAPLR